MGPGVSGVNVLRKICNAYKNQRGVRLSAEEVRELWQYDDALHIRLDNEEHEEE